MCIYVFMGLHVLDMQVCVYMFVCVCCICLQNCMHIGVYHMHAIVLLHRLPWQQNSGLCAMPEVCPISTHACFSCNWNSPYPFSVKYPRSVYT